MSERTKQWLSDDDGGDDDDDDDALWCNSSSEIRISWQADEWVTLPSSQDVIAERFQMNESWKKERRRKRRKKND